MLLLVHILWCLHSGLLRLRKYLVFRRARGVICRAPEPHDITSRDRSVYVITASARSEKAEVARRVWVNMEGCCASCQSTLHTEREKKNTVTMFSQRQEEKPSALWRRREAAMPDDRFAVCAPSMIPKHRNVNIRLDRALKKILSDFLKVKVHSCVQMGLRHVRAPIGCLKRYSSTYDYPIPPVRYFNNPHLATLATGGDQEEEEEKDAGKMLPIVKQKILDRLFTRDVTSLWPQCGRWEAGSDFLLTFHFFSCVIGPLEETASLHSTIPVHSKPEPHINHSAAPGEQSGLFYALAQGHSVVVLRMAHFPHLLPDQWLKLHILELRFANHDYWANGSNFSCKPQIRQATLA